MKLNCKAPERKGACPRDTGLIHVVSIYCQSPLRAQRRKNTQQKRDNGFVLQKSQHHLPGRPCSGLPTDQVEGAAKRPLSCSVLGTQAL